MLKQVGAFLWSSSPLKTSETHSSAGRRTLMADAAIEACGFLDAAHVTAVALTPVAAATSTLAATATTIATPPSPPLTRSAQPCHYLIFIRPQRTTFKRFTPTITLTRSSLLMQCSPHAPAARTSRSSRNTGCQPSAAFVLVSFSEDIFAQIQRHGSE